MGINDLFCNYLMFYPACNAGGDIYEKDYSFDGVSFCALFPRGLDGKYRR